MPSPLQTPEIPLIQLDDVDPGSPNQADVNSRLSTADSLDHSDLPPESVAAVEPSLSPQLEPPRSAPVMVAPVDQAGDPSVERSMDYFAPKPLSADAPAGSSSAMMSPAQTSVTSETSSYFDQDRTMRSAQESDTADVESLPGDWEAESDSGEPEPADPVEDIEEVEIYAFLRRTSKVIQSAP